MGLWAYGGMGPMGLWAYGGMGLWAYGANGSNVAYGANGDNVAYGPMRPMALMGLWGQWGLWGLWGLWDPDDSESLRLPDTVTSTLEGGRFSALRTGRLYPQEYPGTHF
jgi:hypothetical protein